MKKILLFVMAVCLSLTLASCGAGDLTTSSAPAGGTASEESSAPVDKNYAADLKGLIEKLTDNGYFTGEGAPMEAKYVGAFEGYRFVNGNLSLELYQYDTDNLNDDAKRCIKEAKEKGTVTVLDTYDPVPAVLSANEKYLMFYKDNADDADAQARKTKAEEIVRDFE